MFLKCQCIHIIILALLLFKRDEQQTENKVNGSPNFEPEEDELKTEEAFADEEEDINLSYEEFEKLFAVGLVSRSQLASGRVSKKNVEKIRKYLQDYKTVVPSSGSGHNVIADGNLPLTVNCGLKQVESEFYQRDYVVHSPIPMPRKKRNPSQASLLSAFQRFTRYLLISKVSSAIVINIDYIEGMPPISSSEDETDVTLIVIIIIYF